MVRADIDGDGFSELIVRQGICAPESTWGQVTVLHGGAGATAPDIRQIEVGYEPFEIIAADFDGNGRDDLLAWGAFQDMPFLISVLFAHESGNLSAPVFMDLARYAEPGDRLDGPVGDFDGSGTDEMLGELSNVEPFEPGMFLISFSPTGLSLVHLDLDSLPAFGHASDVNHDGVSDFLAWGDEDGVVAYTSI